MPFSVIHNGKVLDIRCEHKSHHPKHWYCVYLGDKMIGQAIKTPNGSWNAISNIEPIHNWMSKGYASRHYCIEYLLRAGEYWDKNE